MSFILLPSLIISKFHFLFSISFIMYYFAIFSMGYTEDYNMNI